MERLKVLINQVEPTRNFQNRRKQEIAIKAEIVIEAQI